MDLGADAVDVDVVGVVVHRQRHAERLGAAGPLLAPHERRRLSLGDEGSVAVALEAEAAQHGAHEADLALALEPAAERVEEERAAPWVGREHKARHDHHNAQHAPRAALVDGGARQQRVRQHERGRQAAVRVAKRQAAVGRWEEAALRRAAHNVLEDRLAAIHAEVLKWVDGARPTARLVVVGVDRLRRRLHRGGERGADVLGHLAGVGHRAAVRLRRHRAQADLLGGVSQESVDLRKVDGNAPRAAVLILCRACRFAEQAVAELDLRRLAEHGHQLRMSRRHARCVRR